MKFIYFIIAVIHCDYHYRLRCCWESYKKQPCTAQHGTAQHSIECDIVYIEWCLTNIYSHGAKNAFLKIYTQINIPSYTEAVMLYKLLFISFGVFCFVSFSLYLFFRWISICKPTMIITIITKTTKHLIIFLFIYCPSSHHCDGSGGGGAGNCCCCCVCAKHICTNESSHRKHSCFHQISHFLSFLFLQTVKPCDDKNKMEWIEIEIEKK